IEENYKKVKETIINSGLDYAGAIYHNNPNFIGVKELAVQNMDWIAQAGVDFIDKHHNEPFFLYFATTIPHGPTEPERSWKADPRITAKGYLDEVPNVLPPRETLPERIKEAGLEGQNKELVLWLDDAVGALLDKLEEKDILENTIIFFFNDHGQKAKGTLYQGGVHNPSIVWQQDGFSVGGESLSSVQNIDFAPTILEYAGIDSVNQHIDGKSFKPVLEAKKDKIHQSLYFELGYARAVIKGKYKYIAIRYPEYAENMPAEDRAEKLERYNEGRRFRNMRVVNEDPAAPFSHLDVLPGGGEAEHASYGKNPNYFDRNQLYNLDVDPNEKNNLANDPEYQDVLKEMQEELKQYLENLPGEFEL
ncbi:MAG: sulfatase, partial [Bacteroidota bacterium]